jgi:thioredoxin reductase
MTSERTEGVADAAIVGGGPAGLTAALFLARYMRPVVLIDSGDPRNWETRGINGFLGLPSVKPAHLRGAGRDEVRKYDCVRLVDDCVEKIDKIDEDCFHLETAGGERFEARRLLLAYGLRDIWPDIDGLDQCYGETVHVCPDCDGYEARGSKVVVIGTGRRAAGLALSLTNWTSDITICTNGERADMQRDVAQKLAHLDINVIETPVRRLREWDGDVRALEFENGDPPLPCQRVFFSLGQEPADDLAAHLGCERDDNGQVVVDAHRHTSVRNVWAAGDIVPGAQLAIASAADGAIAALSIHRSLIPEERRLPER